MSKSDDYYIIRDTIFGSKEIPAYQTNDFGAIPQIVYKYLDLSKLHNKKSLIEDYLWFSDPNTFNDPFDCKMSFAYHLLAENEDVCRKYYEFHVNLNEPNLSIEQKKFVIDKNVDRIISNKSNIYFFQNMEKQMAPSLSEGIKEFGILCTCMINDNILLWSHYASSHTGICLGLKADRLLETY